ncbi:MAG TPA: D-alanine--D-alanine ligase family protein [Trueperaceae bacterium]|nr:D-alanine--D-alanine ligase family protein [Trueperaceae bacterium]
MNAARPRRVLLLCGGRSDEHDVSMASARSVLEAVDGALDVTPAVIDRSGRLLPAEASRRALASTSASAPGDDPPRVPVAGESPATAPENMAAALARLRDEGFDVVFPLLHGPYGEDGSVQGLLRLLGVPFVGSDVLGSAVAMDKLMMKAVLAAHGFPQVGYGGLTRSAWGEDRHAGLASLAGLAWPRFVKPANLGSSIGIRRVETPAELAEAVDAAFAFDRRVIVEEGVVGARELEVAVLGNDAPQVSPVGEIRFQSSFYDYDTKYTDGRAELLIPAPVPGGVAGRARDLARHAFTALDGAGLARVDFLYREASDELFLNEVNTIPGFTRHSMYPKLFRAAGIAYPELIGRLLDLACEPR